MPAMSSTSNSALTLLKPGLMRSPMTMRLKPLGSVTMLSVARRPEADVSQENFLEFAARAELDIAAGCGEFGGPRTRAARGQHLPHAQPGRVADLIEPIERKLRKKANGNAAAHVQIGAERPSDDEALDLVLDQTGLAQQTRAAGLNCRLGQLHRAHVSLAERP